MLIPSCRTCCYTCCYTCCCTCCYTCCCTCCCTPAATPAGVADTTTTPHVPTSNQQQAKHVTTVTKTPNSVKTGDDVTTWTNERVQRCIQDNELRYTTINLSYWYSCCKEGSSMIAPVIVADTETTSVVLEHLQHVHDVLVTCTAARWARSCTTC